MSATATAASPSATTTTTTAAAAAAAPVPLMEAVQGMMQSLPHLHLSKYPLPPPPETRHHGDIAAFIDSLQTLDLVLFSCPLSWYSMELQAGRWTHVGMIYRPDGVHLKHADRLEPGNGAKVLLLESIFGKEEERVSGVDLVDAKQRLCSYFDETNPEIAKWKRGQYVAFRKLNVERTPELLRAVELEYEKHMGKKYETRLVEVMNALVDVFDDAIIPITRNTVEHPESLFCAELVAYMYQGAGLLKSFAQGGTIANEYAPCDFSSSRADKLDLQLGATLDAEVIFGFPPEIPKPQRAVPAGVPAGIPESTLKLFKRQITFQRSFAPEEKREERSL